ncbi:MAG: AGE family epimerase/isomerase [Bergeyella sp.]
MNLDFIKNIKQELSNILNYWAGNTIDEKHGGFIGEIDFEENKNDKAEKGSVMYGRILWAFSAAFPVTKNPEHLAIAVRAFEEIKTKFFNPKFGGIYWSINADGTPKDTKNQMYALAFVIYGLSEFYKISENKDALDLAILLYQSIHNHSFDKEKGGYFEAYTEDWNEIEDVRLSEKDANEKKTMNTHLHIVEAFANLYQVWKNEELRQNIVHLLEIIDKYFIDKNSWHLKLFFDEHWNEKKDVISYGHDIEAAWLLQWCAEISGDENLIRKYKNYAVKMAEVTLQGIDQDGGLWYEFDPEKKELTTEKHWWVQAESWIGFVNAYQLTNDKKYLEIFEKNWNFTEKFIIDKENGEWFWGVDKNYNKIEKDKAGFWKCPYHNARACLEILKRLK